MCCSPPSSLSSPGEAGATKYHRAVEGLLQALLFPALVNPERESHIHNGRKRIDSIRFTNAANSGFFWRAPQHDNVPAGFVVVECKNYNEDVANPEFDQLAGHFPPPADALDYWYAGRSMTRICASKGARTLRWTIVVGSFLWTMMTFVRWLRSARLPRCLPCRSTISTLSISSARSFRRETSITNDLACRTSLPARRSTRCWPIPALRI